MAVLPAWRTLNTVSTARFSVVESLMPLTIPHTDHARGRSCVSGVCGKSSSHITCGAWEAYHCAASSSSASTSGGTSAINSWRNSVAKSRLSSTRDPRGQHPTRQFACIIPAIARSSLSVFPNVELRGIEPRTSTLPASRSTPELQPPNGGSLPDFRLTSTANRLCAPGGNRTPSHRCRTPPLYPLSYKGVTLSYRAFLA